jgi:hypothetical protein
MAQTVALQRGTGTVGVNGSATLFTQSGGISTRVILNQLAFYATSGYWLTPTMTLVHVVSNGSTNVIGWWKPSGSPGSGQLTPNPNGSGPTQTTSSLNPNNSYVHNTTANGGAMVGTYSAYPGSYSQPAMFAYYFYSSNNDRGSYAPQNFWIGPSDSLLFRAYDYTYDQNGGSGGYGATYAYHFTTITES